MDSQRARGREPPVGADLYGGLLREFTGGSYDDYIAAGGRPQRPRVARSLALAQLEPGQTVVDLGAGRGEAALHAARRGCRVVALDSSPGALAMVALTKALAGGERVTLARADCGSVPLPDGCADTVLLLDVVEHLEPLPLKNCLAEASRILKRGGRVVIHTLPNKRALAAYRAAALVVPALPADPRSEYERRVHVNEMTASALAQALDRAHLEHRVWVEEWTTRYAAANSGRRYPDRLRNEAYPLLGGRLARKLLGALMGTPFSGWVGNDIFALAWLPGSTPPAAGGRMAPLR